MELPGAANGHDASSRDGDSHDRDHDHNHSHNHHNQDEESSATRHAARRAAGSSTANNSQNGDHTDGMPKLTHKSLMEAGALAHSQRSFKAAKKKAELCRTNSAKALGASMFNRNELVEAALRG